MPPGDQANDRVSITNTQAMLDMDVSYPDVPVAVDGSAPGVSGISGKPIRALQLTLVSEIAPPVVDGEVVQATSVTVDIGGWKAMVSYNMRGGPQVGAVDWITKLNGSQPRLNSRAVFSDDDIHAVSWHGHYVYAATANAEAGFSTSAVVERLRLHANKLTLDDNGQIPLSSFAATSAMRTDTAIYATSGNAGHVFALDPVGFEVLGLFPLHDARWVAGDSRGDRIVVAQGTPGQLAVFAEDEFPAGMSLLNVFPFPGADVPESKSTVEMAGGKAFIAAGPAGVQIMCLDDGEIVGSVPRPDPAALGLDPSVVVTNAVTVDDDLLFISNGEAGVYVAQGSDDFDRSACNVQQEIQVLGKLRFDDLQSVNHVTYKGDFLFIAAGLGGVKIVHVDRL